MKAIIPFVLNINKFGEHKRSAIDQLQACMVSFLQYPKKRNHVLIWMISIHL